MEIINNKYRELTEGLGRFYPDPLTFFLTFYNKCLIFLC